MKMWTDQYSEEDLIIYQDEDYIIANKPAGVPSQPDKTGDPSILEYLEKLSGISLHMISRLDRPVSGAMICSKVGDQAKSRKVQKSYLAITNKPSKSEDRLEHFLVKDGRRHKAHVADSDRGKKAVLSYKTAKALDKYVVLEVKIETGRFHQIRAQLAHIGCPIKGDVKYGARRGYPDRSIDLHAYKIQLPGQDQPIIAPVLKEEGIWKYIDLTEISKKTD